VEDYVAAVLLWHVLVDGNYCIWVREKMLEFSSTVLPTSSPYQQIE